VGFVSVRSGEKKYKLGEKVSYTKGSLKAASRGADTWRAPKAGENRLFDKSDYEVSRDF